MCFSEKKPKLLKSQLGFKRCPIDEKSPNLAILVSISPTFYERLLRQNPFAKKLQTQIVST
jgi:hypothetical protein